MKSIICMQQNINWNHNKIYDLCMLVTVNNKKDKILLIQTIILKVWSFFFTGNTFYNNYKCVNLT